jgi:hypothetical protein
MDIFKAPQLERLGRAVLSGFRVQRLPDKRNRSLVMLYLAGGNDALSYLEQIPIT